MVTVVDIAGGRLNRSDRGKIKSEEKSREEGGGGGVLGGREKRNRFVEFVCSLQEGQQQPQQAGPRPTNSLGETKSFRLSCSLPTKLFPGATCNDEVRGFTTVGHSWCGVRICTRGYDLQVR